MNRGDLGVFNRIVAMRGGFGSIQQNRSCERRRGTVYNFSVFLINAFAILVKRYTLVMNAP
jgi:hypothetical protein